MTILTITDDITNSSESTVSDVTVDVHVIKGADEALIKVTKEDLEFTSKEKKTIEFIADVGGATGAISLLIKAMDSAGNTLGVETYSDIITIPGEGVPTPTPTPTPDTGLDMSTMMSMMMMVMMIGMMGQTMRGNE